MPNENEQNNDSLVLRPKFIPVYPWMMRNYSYLECIVYGFIDFFLANNNQFYCTDEQLAEILWTSTKSISRSIATLKKWNLIETEQKWKQKWWTFRVIKLKQAEWTKMSDCNPPMDKNVHTGNGQKCPSIKNNILSNKLDNTDYSELYKNYYWKSKWIDEWVCKKQIDRIIKQGTTFTDLYKCMVLYNCECRLRQEWNYVLLLDNRLKKFQPLTEEQIEETLIRIIRRHKDKKRKDEKYWKSLPAKTIWNDLCNTFWKEKVNEIFKNEDVTWNLLHFT